MKFAITGAGVALLCLAGIANAGDTASLQSKGRQLLEKNCSRCHGIGADDKSKHFKAPLFRDVFKRYPAENIAEALAEGIVSGHPDMPEFVFEPAEIDAIVTYLDSLNAAPKN
jgi:cytochrome c